jgi:OmpA-OmpF porin, OOP family
VGLDLVLTPGGASWFALAGGGIAETGEDDREKPSLYVDAGIGWRSAPRPSSPLRFRVEARGVDHVGHDGRTDFWLGAGVELLLSGSAPDDRPRTTPLAASTDSDADGIADAADKCLSTPGDRIGADGCALPEQVVTVTDLTFPSTSLTLTPETREHLDRIAAEYAAQADVMIEIHGHADGTHSEAHNLKLSKARADAVRDYLVQKGIDAERLMAIGFGEMRPLGSNETEPGKALNRRVELHIHTHPPG